MQSFDKRWLAAGAGVVALVVGILLPRQGGSVQPQAHDATVPPTLIHATGPPLAGDPSPTPSSLTVYVCGAVRSPGVYTFAPGSRVIDALKEAGGPLADADVEQINLAAPLADAMKVTVPHKGQTLAIDRAMTVDGDTPATHRHRGHSRGGRSAHKLSEGESLDVNTASAEELVQLPGVGPSLAQRIVDYRQQNGPFQTVDDLQNVPGIGPSKFDRLAPFVRL
ncbi:MAG: ComEA family DNA-binding protein [Candidatus Eremiobacteraeota bacterium]|nr:ComEA family DNA-binding protein [Candidatus Eremiobacteraeota bacterium]MBV8366443.1 ComEA family DNA-binding protein [Candidatus Eremiobacteraeota bacterium]